MKKFILFFACIAFVFSCSDDDEGLIIANQFDGSLESVQEFFSPELVQALLDLGFVINTGNNPPSLEGAYFVSPLILEASSVPTDNVGALFADYTAEFTNQNNITLNIDFIGEGGNQSDVGFGSFVSGDGELFSVYLKNTGTIGNFSAETAIAISGRKTADGIEDFKLAALMLNDNGDPEGVYIENNTGRLLFDSDFMSPQVE